MNGSFLVRPDRRAPFRVYRDRDREDQEPGEPRDDRRALDARAAWAGLTVTERRMVVRAIGERAALRLGLPRHEVALALDAAATRAVAAIQGRPDAGP